MKALAHLTPALMTAARLSARVNIAPQVERPDVYEYRFFFFSFVEVFVELVDVGVWV